mgnify:CR=1 FL=1
MPGASRLKRCDAKDGSRAPSRWGSVHRHLPTVIESCRCLSAFLFLSRGRQYESIVEYQILPRTGELVRKVLPPSQCAVITTIHRVAHSVADVVRESLDQAGFKPTVIAVPAGEESKSMGRVGALCDQMIEAGLDQAPLSQPLEAV